MENQNNNFNDFNELDDMRQQINALRDKVNEQGRLNESLVIKTIQGKMRGVHRTILTLAVMVLFCIPLYIWMKYEENLSWPLIIATIVMMVGSIVSDFFINRINVSHMGDDLVETARKLTQMKKNRRLAQKIGIGVAIVWFIRFVYEFYNSHLDQGVAYALGYITPLIIAAIIGVVIGLIIFHKMQRANDEMINHINELTHEQ